MEYVALDERVTPAVIADILDYYSDRLHELSLKSAWYCLRPILQTKHGYDDKTVIEMLSVQNNALSLIPVGTNNAKEFDDAMSESFPEDTPLKRFWKQLHLIIQLGDILLNDPMQDGELMGLAGMYCWGGRNAESAGLNFGDIKLWHDIPGCWVAWVYKTTKIDSSQLQSGGKTRNADRVVLLPDRYITLILERKKQLQAILGPQINIDDLPIACKGNDYANRCSADDLTKAAKKLFTQLRLPPEQIIAAHDDIRNAMAADIDPLDHLGLDLLEKEPTAYFLRRLYGTALACVGLSEQDVAFQIGHDLGTVPEYRNELLNTGRILTIKQKLDNRPVVNSVMYDKTIILPKHGVSAVDACKKQVYVLNPESRRIELHLSAKEPRDQIQVRILSKGSGKVNIQETAYALGNDKYPMALDISVDCHHIYQRRRSK